MSRSPSDTLKIIFSCVESINKQLPPEGRQVCTAEAVLVGDGGVLDSLGLITLSVSIEQAVSEKLGAQCAVLDELMKEQDNHPFATLGTLAKWIARDISKPQAAAG